MTSEGDKLKTLAGKMAEFAFGLRYDSIPPEIKATARRHLADTIACALGADQSAILLALKVLAID
jgi:2-methylcitrate dehydratase PrpD